MSNPSPPNPEILPDPVQTSPLVDGVDAVEFRLYVDENSLCCKFFADELAKFPAVLSQLQIWHVNNLAPEHKISGVPCIVDTGNKERMWLGSACLDWLKMAVHYSATKIPLRIPMHHILRSLYTSTSTTTSSSVEMAKSSAESSTSSSSDVLDSNQEDSEFVEEIPQTIIGCQPQSPDSGEQPPKSPKNEEIKI